MSNMVVNTNVAALDSHRNMKKVGTAQFTAAARLSSGLKINSAADDAAGLAISEKMRSQIRGLDMASKNAQDAISLIQTAEGGMQEIDNMLQRMRELIVYASNDTLDNGSQSDGSVNTKQGDRRKIQDELDQLATEIDSMANRVEFNKKKLINGDFGGTDGFAMELARPTHMTASAMAETLAAMQSLFGNTGAAYSETEIWDSLDTKSMNTGALYTFMLNFGVNGLEATGDLASLIAGLHTDIRELVNAALLDLVKEITITGGLPSEDGKIDDVDIDNLEKVLLKMQQKVLDVVSKELSSDPVKYNTSVVKANMSAMTALISALDTNTQSISNLAAAMTCVNKQVQAKNVKLTASRGKKLYFQIGANSNQGMLGSIGSVTTKALGIGDGKGLDVNSKTTLDDNIEGLSGIEITKLLEKYDDALTKVTTERAKLGAYQNRLEYTIKSLDVSSENLSAAESRIRDADMGKEMMNLTKANVLQQAATSMLAQNNQNPQMILQLLR